MKNEKTHPNLTEILRIRCDEEWWSAMLSRPERYRSRLIRFVIDRAIRNPEMLAEFEDPKSERTRVFRFRVNPAQKEQARVVSKRLNLKLSRFVRLAALAFAADYKEIPNPAEALEFIELDKQIQREIRRVRHPSAI